MLIPRAIPLIRALLSRIDRYILALICTVGVATVLPAGGAAAGFLDGATKLAVGLLFFLYGARLSPQAAFAGLRHWRLHVPILMCTFALFPLLSLMARPLLTAALSTGLATGLIFLCLLPSTVQSSVAFTSIARGNVAAAICSASFSSLLGVFLTPVLAALLLRGGGSVHFSMSQVVDIVLQLLVPFLAGQLVRPWISDWVASHRTLTLLCDRGSILLVVYSAFSKGINDGIWQRVSIARLLVVLLLCAALLSLVLALAFPVSKWLRYSYEDRVTAVFCASTKSLASGLPIATVLFTGRDVGLVMLPVMLYHMLQLITCAALARRWSGNRSSEDGSAPGSGKADTSSLRQRGTPHNVGSRLP